ncbi:unnamed protein product [Medioppia subpectinata]|uniref:PBZ-type domain-containing protein n=1 Tax=Medioppia subpectinata TaxID=1979941 RepID=A0A7R9KC60_9ACAR|nr:unnamed protein product [Medioppia subpectinata]CAG2100753.1 unnamed protein product [Medioppia subpectinata]
MICKLAVNECGGKWVDHKQRDANSQNNPKTKPKTTAKAMHFLEVDEDLRRMAQTEASKTRCPYGSRCYRKNANHLQQYRHEDSPQKNTHHRPDARQTVRHDVKRGKITDFFVKKPNITPKKRLLEEPKEESDYEIEDDSEDDMNSSAVVSKAAANTGHSSETPKRKKRMSNSKTNSNSKNSMKGKRTADDVVDSAFDDIKNRSPKKSPMRSPSRSPIKVPKFSIVKPIDELLLNNDNKPQTSTEETNTTSDVSECCASMTSPVKAKLTPKQLNGVLKEIFLFEMPKDFFYLWHFCKSLDPRKPEDALIDGLGLRLVGPYDVLTGRIKKSAIKDRDQVLCHWRFYYDLPEFQTILASNTNGYHLGYFRDEPYEENPIVVSNSGDNSCMIEGMADNICAALYLLIQRRKPKAASNAKCLTELESKLKEFCTKNKINFTENSRLKSRKPKVNAKTFNELGFVVPYDKKTEVGYRPLPQTNSELKKLLSAIMKVDVDVRNESKSLADLQEIIQLVSYANDEYDFGMGLELGIDLFCFGEQYFHKSLLYLLSTAYELLKREPFCRIIKAHINNRRKGFHLISMELYEKIKDQFSFSEHRNEWVSFGSGVLFFTGWWIIFDIAARYPSQDQFNHTYYIIGVCATLGLIMINTVTTEQIDGSMYSEGRCGPQTARVWLFLGFIMAFVSLIATIWILFEKFVQEGKTHKYPGVALLLQNLFIFGASILMKYGRNEERF